MYMSARPLILLSPQYTVVMDETNSDTNAQAFDFYLPAMTARPTLGRLESFLERHVGRYGIVPVPYETLGR